MVLIRAQMDFRFCQACKEPFDRDRKMGKPAIDHDHVTGSFRGIICGRCNLVAGLANEIHQLLGIAMYLKERTPVPSIGMYPEIGTE